MDKKERTEALRRAIIDKDADDRSTIDLVYAARDLLNPAENEKAKSLWEAAIMTNRYDIVCAMIEIVDGRAITKFVLNMAAHFNRTMLFRLFLDSLDPSAPEIHIALEVARQRGFTGILHSAWECGVSPALIIGDLMTRFSPATSTPELQKHRAALAFCLKHDLLDATSFQSMIPLLWDCAQCESIAHLWMDKFGFDPQWCDIVTAVAGGLGKTSLWWVYDPLRTWDLRDCSLQTLIELMSLLSMITNKTTARTTAKQRMWELVDEILTLDCRVIILPATRTRTRFRLIHREHPPLHHFVMDGNYPLLLHCWPYLLQACSLEATQSPAGIAPSQDAALPSTANGWLQRMERHPGVEIALAKLHNTEQDVASVFNRLLLSMVDVTQQVLWEPQTFDQVCGQLLLWIFSFDPALADVFLEAMMQAAPALYVYNPGEHARAATTSVVGALVSGRGDCMAKQPELLKLYFFEQRINNLSPQHYYNELIRLGRLDADFERLIRLPAVDFRMLDYIVVEGRIGRGKAERIDMAILCRAIVVLLRSVDPNDETEAELAMKKLMWIMKYMVKAYGQKLMRGLFLVQGHDLISIVCSGHVDAIRLLNQYGIFNSLFNTISKHKVVLAACEAGNLPIAEAIAAAISISDGTQGWLALVDRNSTLYKTAAEIYGRVHIQRWLEDLLEQRATALENAAL